MKQIKEIISEVLDTELYTDDDIRACTLHNVKAQDIVECMRQYGESVVDECANKAMIEEDMGDNWEQNGYEEQTMTHSGGYIREEHYVRVSKASILAIKNDIK